MSWLKVDDSFQAHRKVLRIPKTMRLEALGAWVLAGAWTAHAELDGEIPEYVVEELHIPAYITEELVRVGLWEKVDGGFQMHDYLDYNRSGEECREARQKHSELRAQAGRIGGLRSADLRRQAKLKQTVEANGKQAEADVKQTGEASSGTPVKQTEAASPSKPEAGASKTGEAFQAPDPTRPDPLLSMPRKRGNQKPPEKLEITEEMIAWAKLHTPLVADRSEAEAENCLDWHRAAGKDRRDWVATWRNWMRKAQQIAEARAPAPVDGGKAADGGDDWSYDEWARTTDRLPGSW